MTDIDLSDLAADRDGSRPLRGYLASPAGTGPWPAVVMIHEIFGLDDVMRGHADRLAGLGYLTLAVDLFSAGCTARCLVYHDDRHDPRARPRIRRHPRRPGLPGWFSRLHRQDRRHRVLHRRWLRPAQRQRWLRRRRRQLRSASPPPRRNAGRCLPDRGQLRWPRPVASRCRQPAGCGTRKGRSNPRRRGIPRGEARRLFNGRRKSAMTSLAAGRRHRSRARVGQRRLEPDRTILRHPPQLTIFALIR